MEEAGEVLSGSEGEGGVELGGEGYESVLDGDGTDAGKVGRLLMGEGVDLAGAVATAAGTYFVTSFASAARVATNQRRYRFRSLQSWFALAYHARVQVRFCPNLTRDRQATRKPRMSQAELGGRKESNIHSMLSRQVQRESRQLGSQTPSRDLWR